MRTRTAATWAARSSAPPSASMSGATSAKCALVVVDDVNHALKGLHGQSAGEPRGTTGRQHVVRAGEIVTKTDRRPRSDENRAGVTHAGGDGARIAGDHLKVFGCPRVDHPQPRIEVVNDDICRLARERRAHSCDVPGSGHLDVEFAIDRVKQRRCVSHQQATGQLVVFGLRDEVGGEVARVGRIVGQDTDFGRARLRRRCRPRL